MLRLGLDKQELQLRKEQLAQQYGLDIEKLGLEKERFASEKELAGKRFGLERGQAQLEKKKFGVVSLVKLSVALSPLSLVGCRSGAATIGAAVSSVNVNMNRLDTLPNSSSASIDSV